MLKESNPVAGLYVIGSPLVEEAEIFTGGNTFRARTINNSVSNKYVQQAMLNGLFITNHICCIKILSGGRVGIVYGRQAFDELGC
ncbi:MAG: hypothetical protein DI535_04860 [Citrobacter freundii]|nr:MAG: hypothetical protein DI535_04860 [Citrobacter freundii]